MTHTNIALVATLVWFVCECFFGVLWARKIIPTPLWQRRTIGLTVIWLGIIGATLVLDTFPKA